MHMIEVVSGYCRDVLMGSEMISFYEFFRDRFLWRLLRSEELFSLDDAICFFGMKA